MKLKYKSGNTLVTSAAWDVRTLCTRTADRSAAFQPLNKLDPSLLPMAVIEAGGSLVLFQLFDSLTQSHNLLVFLLLEEL